MNRSLLAAAMPACVVAVGAIDTSSGAAHSSPAPAVTRSAATIQTTTTKLGTVLADGSGRTLSLAGS
jgi:hypothetical protein